MKRFANPKGVVAGTLILVIALTGAARFVIPGKDGTLPAAPSAKPNPQSENILFATGLAFGALGNMEAARESFSRIRLLNPASLLGYAPVSRTYIAEGRLDQALYWISAAQRVAPEDLELGGWRVLLYDSMEDYESAGLWSDWLSDRVTNQAMPMAMQASHHYLAGNFELALQISNLALKFNFPSRWNSDATFVRIKRDEALASGEPEKGIEFFAGRYPELLQQFPEVRADNITQATDLALLLKMAGRVQEAQRLLAAVLAAYDQPFLTGGSLRTELMPVKAEALAILGDEPGSLAELRRVIDTGWRAHWRWKTDLNPNFSSVRRSATFHGMVAELEADMAQQRFRAEELAASEHFRALPASDGSP